MLQVFGEHVLAYCALCVVLLVASVTDLKKRIIPNGCIVAGIAIWLVTLLDRWLSYAETGQASSLDAFWSYLASSVAGAFGVAVFLLLVSLVFDTASGKHGLGGGDIKLFFVTGLFLGLALNVLNLFISCALGALFGLWWKRKENCEGFPFAPVITVSTFMCLLLL